MKSEDTVIKAEDIKDLWIPCETCHRKPFWESMDNVSECIECIALKHRERQADLSFKAGIKEVVEWVKENAPSVVAYAKHSPFDEPIWAISKARWEAKRMEE